MINTKTMNECLLAKWIWRILNGSDAMWFKIIHAKYLRSGSFFSSPCAGTSQFWQSLHKVKHLFRWGACIRLEMGEVHPFGRIFRLIMSPSRPSTPNCTR